MTNKYHVEMFEDLKNYWPGFARDCAEYIPYSNRALVLVLNDRREYFYDGINHTIHFERPRLYDENDEEYLRRKIAGKMLCLMRNLALNQELLSERVGIPQKTISRFIHGDTFPTVYKLFKISQELGCTVDTLVSERVIPAEQIAIPDEDMFIENLSYNLRLEMLNIGINQQRLSELTETPQGTLSRYIRGATCPSILVVYKIARVFGCTIDDLVYEGIV